MREIKFRGISQRSGKLVYGQLLHGDKGFNIVVDFKTNEHIKMIPIFKGTQSQYTGLKDVNDVEIYEGDILYTLDNNEEYEEYVGVVEYDSVGRFVTTGFPHVTSGDCFVKGNIYKNQELLVGDSNV